MSSEPAEPMVFRPSLWRMAAYAPRAVAPSLIVILLVLTRAGWPLALRALLAAAIAAFAIAAFPRKFLRATIYVYADRFEYLRGDGKRETVRWNEITHMTPSASFVRLLDMRRPDPVIFGRPILVSRRRDFIRILRTRATGAAVVSRLTWLKMVLRAGVDFAKTSR